VFVSTNERFADAFADYLTDSPFKKPTLLSVEETVEEDEKFGVVGALAQLVERENVDDDPIVVAGDNMISFDLSDFADFFESKGTPTLAAYDVGTASAPSPTGSSISTATRSSTSRRSPTTRRRRSSPSRVTRSPRRRCPTSRRTLKTATTPTSRGGSSSGSRSAARSTRTPSTARGSTSAPPTATSTRWSTRSTVERSLPTTRSSRTPIRRRGPRHVGRHRHRLDARTRRRLPERNDH